ncbi:MAG: hypothetical protein ABIS27_11965 [Longimicrobiales bacterium]
MPVEPIVPVLILSGTVGVGKTTVLNEVHDVLSGARVPHACIDRDAYALSWPARGAFNQHAVLQNVAAVWANFSAAGAERLVIAGVVEQAEDLKDYRRAVPGARLTVCQLAAAEATRCARLQAREAGESLEWHLRRTVELQQIFDETPLYDFTVTNEDGPVRPVALEILTLAGWPTRQVT